MIRYVLIAASVAVLASLSACIVYHGPTPRVGGPDARQERQDRASYSSQLSVINRRACREKHEKDCDYSPNR